MARVSEFLKLDRAVVQRAAVEDRGWSREAVESGDGQALFFVVAPGTVVGVVPWLLTGWQVRDPLPDWAPLRVVGAVLLIAGVDAAGSAFVRFVVEGLGTPAPVAAPERLVDSTVTCATPCT